MRKLRLAAAALVLPLLTVSAQDASEAGKAPNDTAAAAPSSLFSLLPPIQMQYFRPADQRGVSTFEAPKEAGIPFTGFHISWGAAFRQQFQGLEHRNKATPVVVNGVNQNQLIDIGGGFNLARANLSLNMQVADGMRVQLATYLSSKHHQEAWVKDGYALIDKSPIDNPILNKVMKYTTLKVGHFETNFGDQHFRRSDNGNAMANPFVGNYIIDAFTTEIGGEAYFRPGNGMLAMAGLNSGTINGGVTAPAKRTYAYTTKLGYDKQLTSDLRVRLTGSYYRNEKSPSNTLLTGDRSGGPYDLVMENTAATLTGNAWSGQIRPGLANNIRAIAVNPFIKWQGFEFFGSREDFKGKANAEPVFRNWTQTAGEALYRIGAGEKAYVGARAINAKGDLRFGTSNRQVGSDRYAASAGWFVTPVLLMKGEYMQQKYNRFPTNDIRYGGRIQGFVVEGVVAF